MVAEPINTTPKEANVFISSAWIDMVVLFQHSGGKESWDWKGIGSGEPQ